MGQGGATQLSTKSGYQVVTRVVTSGHDRPWPPHDPNCKTQHRPPPPLQRARAGPWRCCPDGHDSAIGRPAASRRRRQQRRRSCSSSSDAERDCLAERLQLQPQLRPSSSGRRRSAAASAGLLWCPSGRTNPFILGPHGATARTFS